MTNFVRGVRVWSGENTCTSPAGSVKAGCVAVRLPLGYHPAKDT